MKSQRQTSVPPVLLFDGKFYGTLAAVRCFGRLGVAVTMAESNVLAPARWSKYVTRRVSAPPVHETAAFLSWLLEWGHNNPKHLLYPTSDEMAWLLAQNRAALSACYYLFSPSEGCISQILNKDALHSVCRQVGIDVPDTFVPRSGAELEQLVDNLPYPVIVKPQTQLFFKTHTKGGAVYSREELIPAYTAFMQHNTYAEEFRALYPGVEWPMLQRYYPEAKDGIYNISGFIDASGDIYALRAARKILQKPRRLGVGVCFEAQDVDPELAQKLVAACKATGYYGVFEAEFIQNKDDGRALLIDFNPRFYGQMAFDIVRRLPMPALVYYAAVGDTKGLLALLDKASSSAPVPVAYGHRLLVSLMVWVQTFKRLWGTAEGQRWEQWLSDNRGYMADAVSDSGDPAPICIEYLRIARGFLRHPKGFIRELS